MASGLRALMFSAPRTAAVVDLEARPSVADGEALVAPSHVGLCGTDLELFTGSMPYFGQGVASYPLQPGHEVTGVVVSSRDDRPPPGVAVVIDPVVGCGACPSCAGGMQTRCPQRRELGIRGGMPGGACDLIAVPARNLHPIPPSVSPRDAVLVEPGVTVLNAIQRLGELEQRRAVVIGAGTLGLIAAQLLSRRGATVDVVVVEPARAALVERLGGRPVECAATGAYDVVLEAAGSAAAVHSALRAVAPGGRVALTGVQPEPVDQVDVNEVVLKDATVFGVLNGPGLYQSMLAELAAGSVDAAALIDSEFELADAAAALSALATPNRPAPKVMLRIDRGRSGELPPPAQRDAR